MAIPTEIETALTDKPDVLKFVKGLDARAEKLTPEVEAALPKLGELAKIPELQTSAAALAKILEVTKAKDADAVISDFAGLKGANADLVRQRDNWKATGKSTDSPEYKALEEKITQQQQEFGAKITALETESRTNKEAATRSALEKRDTDLKSAVISAASKFKIRDAEDEFLLLKAKGLIGHKEDGTAFFYKLNEKGEKVDAVSAEGLLKHIAETNKAKVDASGKGGVGADHKGGVGTEEGPKTASEARGAFLRK